MMPKVEQAKLSTVAEFPPHYFLENMTVRADGSMLITVQNRKELWYVPAPTKQGLVTPALLQVFEFNTTFVVEWRPDIFLLGVADVYETLEAKVYRIDMRNWQPGQAIEPTLLLHMPEPHAGFNGAAFVAPDVLIAAGMARLLWRIDLADPNRPSARPWLEHDSMKNRPGEKKPQQPGTNGVQYSARTGHLYYTSTSQQLMMRIKVDPRTFEPADLPEFVAGGRQWDDFLIDDEAGVAYATTHRENTIERVRLAQDGNREGWSVVAGDPFNELLIGPSAGAWGRLPDERGRVAYFTTDGGTAQPPDGVYRPARILRFEPPPVEA